MTTAPRTEKARSAAFGYIQMLRFFAAAIVVVFHCLGTAKNNIHGDYLKFFDVFSYGYIGVDLFFVISGFIIYYSVHRTEISAYDFFIKRLERIVPVYWVAMFIFFGIGVAFPVLYKSGSPSVDVLLQSLFFIRFTTGQPPIVYVGWSLEYEMFFYLLTSFLLLKKGREWNYVVGILCLLSMAHPLAGENNTVKFLTSPYFIEFSTGIMVAKIFAGRKIHPLLLLLLAGSYGVAAFDPDYVRVPVLAAVFGGCVYLAARISSGRKGYHPVEQVLIKLGDASYSIYLYQVFFISLLIKILARVPALGISLTIIISSVLSIAAGYAVHLCLERPLQKFFKSLHQKRREAVAG